MKRIKIEKSGGKNYGMKIDERLQLMIWKWFRKYCKGLGKSMWVKPISIGSILTQEEVK